MGGGGWRAAVFWTRIDFRHRWRSLVLLGVLAGVVAGLAFSALVGARRTDSALPRLLKQTNTSDAVVFTTQVGVLHPNWARLRARPEVATVAVWNLLFGNIDGQEGGVLFGSANRTFLGKVDKVIVVQGRMFNPRAADEVVVDENGARQAPLGTTFTFRPYAPTQIDAEGQPHGPKITMHVVGVVRNSAEFLFVSSGQALVSPGFFHRYGHQILLAPNANVTLRHGEAGIPALRRDVNQYIAKGAPVLDLHSTTRRLNTTLSVERIGLLILAIALALGGGLLVTLVIGRSAAPVGQQSLTLSAMGLRARDRGLTAALSHLAPGVVAAATSILVAWVASDRYPVGLGRRVDPSVGYHIDWTVVGPGAAFVLAAVVGSAFLIGWRPRADGGATTAATPSIVGGLRKRLSLVSGLGTSMAFESDRRRARTSVISALVAPMVGVLGIVATITIDRGINEALANPARAGVTWDLTVYPTPQAQTGRGVTAQFVKAARRGVPSGSKMVVVDRDVLDVGGVGVPTFDIRPVPGSNATPISLTVTAGHAPRNAGEADIGPATARDLHVGIGDTVRLAKSGGSVRIVGEALFPSDVHAEFDEGLWVTPSRLDKAVRPSTDSDDRVLAVRLPSGASVQTSMAHLGKALGPMSVEIDPPQLPDELLNLGNVHLLPNVLAGFLGLMAVIAAVFVLVSSTRSRRKDFAVLQALGMTRRQVRSVVHVQGSAIGLFALVAGIPLGIMIGRSGWHLISTRVPLSYDAPLALLAMVLIVPATLLVLNAAALGPGLRVSRATATVDGLRAE